MRPHPKRAATNPRHPRGWGTCDRSGFITNQEKLVWQHDWRGTQLVNLRILVAPDMLDKPQRQLGTIILPPDPVALLNARPEQYVMDEESIFYLIQHAVGSSSASNSASVSLLNRPQQGNIVIAGAVLAGAGIGNAVASDNTSNHYTQTPSGINLGTNLGLSVFYLPDAPANAGKTITVTSSSSMAGITVFAAEFAGPQAVTPFDTEAFATGTGGSINAPTITTGYGDLVFTIVGANGGIITANAPWLALDESNSAIDAYLFQPRSGSETANFSNTATGGDIIGGIYNGNPLAPIFTFGFMSAPPPNWACQIVGFKSWGTQS